MLPDLNKWYSIIIFLKRYFFIGLNIYIYIKQAPMNYNWYLPTMLTKRMYTFSACFIPEFDCFVITGWYNQSSIRRKPAAKTFVEAHLVIANGNYIWVILRGKLLEWWQYYLVIRGSVNHSERCFTSNKSPHSSPLLKTMRYWALSKVHCDHFWGPSHIVGGLIYNTCTESKSSWAVTKTTPHRPHRPNGLHSSNS